MQLVFGTLGFTLACSMNIVDWTELFLSENILICLYIICITLHSGVQSWPQSTLGASTRIPHLNGSVKRGGSL